MSDTRLDDAVLNRLREEADHLRVKLSIAFDSDRTASQELIAIQRALETVNETIAKRMRDLRYRQ